MQKALDSLSEQTLTDTEYICVNDGSTDKSLAIMNAQAKKDSRFKVFNQKINQGTGRTRNNGLRMARGEYITFLDPDDWFEHEALSSLYKQAKEQNCDMLVFDFKTVDENGKLLKINRIAQKVRDVFTLTDGVTFNWKDIKGKLFGGLHFAAWNKMYKRAFIKAHNLHFANCSFAEDSPFVLGSTLNAQRIGYTTVPQYNYLIHNNSAIRTRTNKNLCLFKSLDTLKRIIEECGLTEELSQEFDTYVIKRCNKDIDKVKSRDTFEMVRHKKIAPRPNRIVDNLRETGTVIMRLLEGLKLKK